MSKPLNPLIIARLRKYWLSPKMELGELLSELDSWIYILGAGPQVPTCEYCQTELNFNWKLCHSCQGSNVLCDQCDECYNCQALKNSENSAGCCDCGEACGAYMCHYCKINNQ